MKVTLCYAPVLPGRSARYGLQPLGVLYIAALLKQEGFDVGVLDADMPGLTVRQAADRILAGAPDVVGLSMMTPQVRSGQALAVLLKEARPDLPVVAGGAHLDATREDALEECRHFDFGVHGEGEHPMLELCTWLSRGAGARAPEDLAGLRNLIWRDASGRVRTNPARPFLADLDSLPSVDYDMVDVERYAIPVMTGRFVISMMLSRGCPFSCTFCDAPITMGRRLRQWSVPRVVRDIRRYRDRYGARHFVFKDSTFTANRGWVRELCEALLDARLGIRWRCSTRANLVPPDLLELMARAGCSTINFGVESGDEEVLRRIRKEVDLDDVVDAFERCRRLGIRTYATLLVGSPGETEETVRRTIAFAKRIRPSLCAFFVATAYPGTPMYEAAVASGEIEPRWWVGQRHDPERHSAFETRWGFTGAGALRLENGLDAEYWQRRATREWYLRPRFAWDTAGFVLRHPSFLRHAVSLGLELVPFYRLRNLLPGRRLDEDEREEILARCPSAPNWPRAAARTGAGGGGRPPPPPRPGRSPRSPGQRAASRGAPAGRSRLRHGRRPRASWTCCCSRSASGRSPAGRSPCGSPPAGRSAACRTSPGTARTARRRPWWRPWWPGRSARC